jgi:hypothetical protein
LRRRRVSRRIAGRRRPEKGRSRSATSPRRQARRNAATSRTVAAAAGLSAWFRARPLIGGRATGVCLRHTAIGGIVAGKHGRMD